MLRRAGSSSTARALLLAAAIPRHVWDPQRHDPKWVDSLAKPIADRRAWSAKKYTVGLEPKTPREWLEYSLRNLAYEYNAAMRACETFSDLIPIYQEMKHRGVKVDVDTMYVVLGRAARFEGMKAQDVFNLFDELVSLGARPDGAVIEIVHTAWELSSATASSATSSGHGAETTWRELRRRDLIRWYHRLAVQDVAAYGNEHGLDKLMLQQLRRYRSNLQSLGSVMHSAVWCSVLAQVRDSEDLVTELQAMMWERAPADAAYSELTSPGGRTVTVPILGEHLSRLVISAPSSSSSSATSSSNKKSSGAAKSSKDGGGGGGGGDDANLEQSGASAEQLADEQAHAASAVLSAAAAAGKTWSIEDDSLDFLDDVLVATSKKNGFDAALSFSASTHRRCLDSMAAVAHFEDFALNRGVLAALERLVDDPFPVNEQTQSGDRASDAAIGLALVAMSWRSGMLLSADVVAQALDMVRFAAQSPLAGGNEQQRLRRREQDAVRYLRFALRATSMQNRTTLSNAAVAMWRNQRCSIDDRVVARYVHCRDPWSDVVFCPQQGQQMFGAFSSRLADNSSSSSESAAKKEEAASAAAAADGTSGEEITKPPSSSSSSSSSSASSGSAASATGGIIQERWSDLMALFERFTMWNKRVRTTGTPLSRQEQVEAAAAAAGAAGGSNESPLKTWTLTTEEADGLTEVMTSAADFLMRMTITVASSGNTNYSSSSRSHQHQHQLQLVRSLDQLFRIVAQLKRDVEITCSVAHVEGDADAASTPLTPSPECWECMLVSCRNIMDQLVNSRSQDLSLQRDADALFGQVAALRSQMMHEARGQYDGKLKMLWLQES